jgi:hypothetical protein
MPQEYFTGPRESRPDLEFSQSSQRRGLKRNNNFIDQSESEDDANKEEEANKEDEQNKEEEETGEQEVGASTSSQLVIFCFLIQHSQF